MEAHYYGTDQVASREAVRLITKWNAKNFVDRMVKLNLPEVWTFDRRLGQLSGQENPPRNFHCQLSKFNSNMGWADDTLPWPRVMQALSHFTYHISNGQTLLCDLQGGVYSNGIVLTITNEYGPTDLGKTEKHFHFFAYHV